MYLAGNYPDLSSQMPHLLRKLQIFRWFKDAVSGSSGVYQSLMTTSPCTSGSCSESVKMEGGGGGGGEGGGGGKE